MKKRVSCFVAMPFGSPDAEFLQGILRLLPDRLKKYEVEFYIAGERLAKFSPLESIRDTLKPADFILCLFDGKNQNVIFELGMAYGLRRPTFIVLTEDYARLPSSLMGHFWARLDRSDFSGASMAAILERFLDGLVARDADSQAFVFLCHRSIDKPAVEPLASRLEGKGYRVWYDSWSIFPGDSIPEKIAKGIEESTHFILCLSRNTQDSKWVTKEFNTALTNALERNRPRIIPVFLDHEGRRSTPTLIRELRGVSFYSQSFEEAFAELILGIRSQEDAT
jgi:hypothetical protein